MAIALYKKGATHIVDDVHCTVVLVNNPDEMSQLLSGGDHFHTVAELTGEKKQKPGRKPKEVAEVVESTATDEQAAGNEDENTAD